LDYANPSSGFPMIPTFVIFLREGIEASMIVAILLAYLDKIGQRRHFRDVFLAWPRPWCWCSAAASPPTS